MVRAIRESLDYALEETLEWAVYLRHVENIRVTPQEIVVEAANMKKAKGTGLIRHYAREVIGRADEPATQLAYQLATFGKPIPNALKRAWADVLKSSKGYTLAKYRMERRIVKTVDVANLAYGKGFYGYDEAIGKLMRGELKLTDNRKTWESILSDGGTWQEAINVMGHMALLRNIRNFTKNKVDENLWLDKLVAGAEKGRQLPFRYLTAYNVAKRAGVSGRVLDAIEECLELSVGNLPNLRGRSLILADNSGSTRECPISSMSTMSIAQIGNLMGVLTGKISDDGVVGVFGDRLEYMSIRKRASVLDQQRELENLGRHIGGASENGVWLALDRAIRNKEHWDNIFVYSDMQAGHGGLYGTKLSAYREFAWPRNRRYIDVAKLVDTYRNRVNADVNVFLVQIAGYEDTIIPEYYYRTFIIGGWSDGILRFANTMINQFDKVKQ
jgi:hypothetical protein